MYKLIGWIPVFSQFFQEDGPFSGTSTFQRNFFFGGIGLWFIFFLLALIALIWVFFDSNRRKLDATAWKVAVIVCFILVLPAMVFKFAPNINEVKVNEYVGYKNQIYNLERYQQEGWIDEVDNIKAILNNQYHPLTGYIEMIMYLTLLGGLGGVGVALAFFVTFQGVSGGVPASPMGPGGQDFYVPPPPPAQPRPSSRPSRGQAAPPGPMKNLTNAWLVAQNGKSYQLCEGTTLVGRSSRCDIQISNDTKISKEHAKFIQQANGRFRLMDMGSTNGTFVNEKRVRGEVVVDPNDRIRFGDDTTLTFKS